jgi:hypothetical protein
MHSANLCAACKLWRIEAAWGGFMRAAQTLKSDSSFAGLTGSATYPEINDFLTVDLRKPGVLAQAKGN